METDILNHYGKTASFLLRQEGEAFFCVLSIGYGGYGRYGDSNECPGGVGDE